MGWEYVDDIVWLKPEPSAKNRVAGFNLHRKPLAYKPNCVTETLMVYRKKSNKLIDWIFKQYPEEVIKKSKIKDGPKLNNETPKNGVAIIIAGTIPINVLNRAVAVSAVIISLIFKGATNKLVKFLLQISSRNNILKLILDRNRKS